MHNFHTKVDADNFKRLSPRISKIKHRKNAKPRQILLELLINQKNRPLDTSRQETFSSGRSHEPMRAGLCMFLGIPRRSRPSIIPRVGKMSLRPGNSINSGTNAITVRRHGRGQIVRTNFATLRSWGRMRDIIVFP